MEKFFDYFNFNMPKVGPVDIAEMFILWYIIYTLLKWLKSTKAWVLIKGLAVIAVAFGLAALFNMNTILWIGEKLISVLMVAMVIVFQPELRKALESLGRKNFTSLFSFVRAFKSEEKKFNDTTSTGIVTACLEMGAVKTGALICIENKTDLTDYINTGISLDANVSRSLLINIFEKNTPLHDGAVIIRGDKVVSATCYLPLSDNMSLPKKLGTRHRAALGLAEVTDALIIVVSEETGKISIAQNGQLRAEVSEEELIGTLNKMQITTEDDKPEGGVI